MALSDDLKGEVGTIFKSQWSSRDGQVVPEPESVKLGNDAVKLQGTVLYADLSQSTAMVQGYKPHFAAEVYKAFLHCAAKIIKANGGVITSYDGDRIMAVYVGGTKNTDAARTGLRINYACKKIIQPAINAQYKTNYAIKHSVGIDTSPLFVARTGVRGNNDLVWVGRAANWAAKLSDMSDDYPTWITGDVYKAMMPDIKTYNGKSVWEARSWTPMNGATIYRSSWTWTL